MAGLLKYKTGNSVPGSAHGPGNAAFMPRK